MKKEIFNYNLLCKLNSLFFNSTLGAIAIKLILFKENPPLELMIYIYSLYSIQTATNGIQIASRHVVTNKIKKDYIEFLKNYKEMLSKFDLKNPLEVETMYCYALNNGYLSVDKNFAFDINIGKNDCFLLGSFVMTGMGYVVIFHLC